MTSQKNIENKQRAGTFPHGNNISQNIYKCPFLDIFTIICTGQTTPGLAPPIAEQKLERAQIPRCARKTRKRENKAGGFSERLLYDANFSEYHEHVVNRHYKLPPPSIEAGPQLGLRYSWHKPLGITLLSGV
uniref:Uncharacterized protein n=1 Tax=Lygus hesperus TaxID=30085 RepID=A0A0K8S9B3_LYGHE